MNRAASKIKRYNYLINEINSVYHEIALTFGIAESIQIILYVLCENGGECMLKTIRKDSGLSKQTVNSAIRKLEALKYIYLEPCGEKNKLVRITPLGDCFAEHSAKRIISAENEIFNAWDKSEFEKYIQLTERFLNELRIKQKELKNEK